MFVGLKFKGEGGPVFGRFDTAEWLYINLGSLMQSDQDHLDVESLTENA